MRAVEHVLDAFHDHNYALSQVKVTIFVYALLIYSITKFAQTYILLFFIYSHFLLPISLTNMWMLTPTVR
jgi:hypothetical protein